jgi:hypothetical protein
LRVARLDAAGLAGLRHEPYTQEVGVEPGAQFGDTSQDDAMKPMTASRTASFLSTMALLACASCADLKNAKDAVADKTSDVKGGAEDRAQAMADRADQWLNQEPLQQREEACQQEQGTWTKKITISACEDGLTTVEYDGQQQQQTCEGGEGGEAEYQCLHKDRDGLVYFNDGPSVPNALQRVSGTIDDRVDYYAYNRLYWPAGMNHDYCYHHGHATYGYDKKACDQQYFRDLSAVCKNPANADIEWFDEAICRKIAVTHYSAVRKAGDEPYNVLSSQVRYPEYEPLWKSYGLDGDPTNEEAMEDVDQPSRRVDLL